jgi:hypothetical protein
MKWTKQELIRTAQSYDQLARSIREGEVDGDYNQARRLAFTARRYARQKDKPPLVESFAGP